MNSSLRKNSKYPFIRRALARRYDKTALAGILDSAEAHYAALAARCASAAPGEWTHLNNTILPACAVYRALLEKDAPNALTVTHDALIGLCETAGRMMQLLLCIPGMKGLFMHLLPQMAQSLFGRECGFDYVNFRADRTHLAMDTIVCPYCKYARLLDCEALMPTFCESDFATYGHLPGIRFERSMTLGTGGDRCDFRFTRE